MQTSDRDGLQGAEQRSARSCRGGLLPAPSCSLTRSRAHSSPSKPAASIELSVLIEVFDRLAPSAHTAAWPPSSYARRSNTHGCIQQPNACRVETEARRRWRAPARAGYARLLAAGMGRAETLGHTPRAMQRCSGTGRSPPAGAAAAPPCSPTLAPCSPLGT